MYHKRNESFLLLTALAAAAIVLSGPAKAQVAAGFDHNASSGLISGFAWTVNSGAVTHCANGSGGSNTAMFGVSESATNFVGVADDSSGLFHGAAWNGVNAASTTPPGGFFDSGVAQGFPGNDTPWSINDGGNAVGQGVGQISGYDTGFFAGIEWTGGGVVITDLNALNDPASNPINSSSYYGGPIYIEGFDISGVGLNASGINTSGQISALSFQNFGSFYYQGVIVNGSVKVIPYFDAADPAATSWNISEAGATAGYNFINSLSQAVGYTATVAGSGYSYSATSGGTGTLNNYGSGPNNNFQWFITTNDDGSGMGQAVGFDIDSTGSYNHAVYDMNDTTSQEIADDRGGNTTFLVGVAGDGTSAGFETIAADGEAFFHAWGTKTGTPGATVDYSEPSGTEGSKAFLISRNLPNTCPKPKEIHGEFKKGKYKDPIVLKHGKSFKISIILDKPAGGGGQVVTVTSSDPTVFPNFTITVPAGQTTVNNAKGPKVSKTAKGKKTKTCAMTPWGTLYSGIITVK